MTEREENERLGATVRKLLAYCAAYRYRSLHISNYGHWSGGVNHSSCTVVQLQGRDPLELIERLGQNLPKEDE